ncbi:MAG: hypothetical protein QXS90_00365 [Candidatus Diapherotrites archaeon]
MENNHLLGNDVDLLYGLALDLSENEVGALMTQRSVEAKRKAHQYMRMATTPNVTSKGSRAQMENKLLLLPSQLRHALKSGKAQISDATYYTTKSIVNQNGKIDMFLPSDDKREGFSNVNKAELETNRYFLLESIRLTASQIITFTTPGSYAPYDYVGDADYDTANIPTYILNGEWAFIVGSRTLFANQSTRVFAQTYMGVQAIQKGQFHLDNPKLVPPNVRIKFELSPCVSGTYTPTTYTTTQRHYIRVELMGSEILSF